MEVAVNYWAVLLAGVSSMLVGAIWYGPLFGKKWQKLAKVSNEKVNQGAAQAYGLAIATALLVAFILAHMIFLAHSFFKNSFMQDAVTTSFWLWLGIAATTIIVHDAFERRPVMLTLINVGYHFAMIMVMGVIIGWLAPEVVRIVPVV